MKRFRKKNKMILAVSLALMGLVSAESTLSGTSRVETQAGKAEEGTKSEKVKKPAENHESVDETEKETADVVEMSDEIELPAKIEEPENKDESMTEEEAEAADEARASAKAEKDATGEKVDQQVFGWKEWVTVGTKADKMRAKLDSGARTSSLHAEGQEEFERDGRKWVRFSLRDPDEKDSKSILIKAPVERVARVKNTDGTVESRYVVELAFTIGDRQLREEFTLNDRADFICPVLIGRNALRNLGYIDCSRVDLASKKILTR